MRLAVVLGLHSVRSGLPRWRAQVQPVPRPDWVLIGRMEEHNQLIQDCCLVLGGPKAFELGTKQRRIREQHVAEAPEPLLDLVLHASDAPDGDTP